MQEAKKGYRKAGDDHLFSQQNGDRSIVPDRVSPAVEGYFRIPAVWIGENPDPDHVKVLNPTIHHATAIQRKLACGIECRVQRDGTFLFDFSTWALAPLVVIPGYIIPDLKSPHTATREHQEAEDKAESIAVFRAQVMNAHQACLTASERLIRHRSAMTGFPVTAWNTLKALTLDTPPSYGDNVGDIHALAKNVLNNKDMVVRQSPLSRRLLELDVVEHSFTILDDILLRNEPAIVQLIEAAYISACRWREKRFGECIIVGWSVCEQLISLTWNKMLDTEKGKQDGAKRMPADRRRKLTGRDYTASVRVELLDLQGRIDHDLYRLLEIARKARNQWAHDMKAPGEQEVSCCHQAIYRLLKQVLVIDLPLQPGGYGGVPQWPVWMWNQLKKSS